MRKYYISACMLGSLLCCPLLFFSLTAFSRPNDRCSSQPIPNRLRKLLCCCGGSDVVGDGDQAVDEAHVATEGQGVEVDEPA